MAILGADAPCLGCFIEQSDGGPLVVSSIGADPGGSMTIHTVPSTGDGLVVLTNGTHKELAIAQVDALWASWRGLPPPQAARSLRNLGGPAIGIVSLASAAIIAIGLGCLNGVLVGRRRFAAFNASASLGGLIELCLVATAAVLWFLGSGTIGQAPGLAVVLRADLVAMILVVTGRVLFPEVGDAGDARRSKRQIPVSEMS